MTPGLRILRKSAQITQTLADTRTRYASVSSDFKKQSLPIAGFRRTSPQSRRLVQCCLPCTGATVRLTIV